MEFAASLLSLSQLLDEFLYRFKGIRSPNRVLTGR
jgi:hypothetical protein